MMGRINVTRMSEENEGLREEKEGVEGWCSTS